MQNHKGRADAFCTFSPFRSWWSRLRQWVVFAGAPDKDEQIRAEKFLHFGFWTSLRRRDLEDAGIPDTDIPANGALLFSSVFNGRADDYIAGFSEHLHAEMDQLWTQTEGWQGASDVESLTGYIDRHQRPVNLFFNAYRDDARGIRGALRLRRRLDALADLPTEGAAAPDLSKKLATLARSLEGAATDRDEDEDEDGGAP